MYTEAFVINKTGSSKELILTKQEIPDPDQNEIQIQHQVIGINFIDIYHRKGLYPVSLPAVLGMEGVGRVLKVGVNVNKVCEGDTVGYAFGSMGAYQKVRNINAGLVFSIKPTLVSKVGGSLLRGLTAEYLVNRIDPLLKKDDVILLHAAAGGVGLIVLQWLKHKGVKVIATAGSEEKIRVVKNYQADLVLNYRDKDLVAQIKSYTQVNNQDGKVGVKIVFDSIGKDTFENSLACLSRRGIMVSYGNASGAVPPLSPLTLSQKGSLFLTRPTLADYYSNSAEIKDFAPRYLNLLEKGIIENKYQRSFSFNQLPQSHDFLEEKRSVGVTLVEF